MAGLSACAPSSAGLPDGVTVEIKQYRLDYAPRALEISVTNGSGASVTITRAAFESPLFDGTTSWTRSTEIPPGSTRDLRVLLGAPVCDAPSPVAEPAVALSFETADGAAGESAVAPTDPFDTIAKVTALDCVAERTSAVADLSTGGSLRTEMRDGQLVALLDLTASPTGADGSVAIASAGRTTLLAPSNPDADSWPLDWSVSGTSGALATTLDIAPSNCNPHILAEDKRGTFFPLAVTLDDGSVGTVFVGVSDSVREQLYDYVAGYCAW